MIAPDIIAFNTDRPESEIAICERLAILIDVHLPEAENKIWLGHPVWFLQELYPSV